MLIEKSFFCFFLFFPILKSSSKLVREIEKMNLLYYLDDLTNSVNLDLHTLKVLNDSCNFSLYPTRQKKKKKLSNFVLIKIFMTSTLNKIRCIILVNSKQFRKIQKKKKKRLFFLFNNLTLSQANNFINTCRENLQKRDYVQTSQLIIYKKTNKT